MYEPVWINPVDSGPRGIENGDIVKMYNERGIVLGGAYVTERIIPGAVSQDHGARYDPITTGLDRGGSNDLIYPANATSRNAYGIVSSGFLVEVERVSSTEMEMWGKITLKLLEENMTQRPGCILMHGLNHSGTTTGRSQMIALV